MPAIPRFTLASYAPRSRMHFVNVDYARYVHDDTTRKIVRSVILLSF